MARKVTYEQTLVVGACMRCGYLCAQVVKLKLGTGCKSSGNGAIACHAADTLS
jgi:hypothetical protein